ncbi:hypothetical protein SNOG_11514 [Parastagonospora nodorum SN15]|uniref:Uncharacterized protein n=1 Tax=Phaeosphaeria nodorum (strain SN15 / ATCC MYA-4574 / FGSC 10173) TaxID=321614 RepID=Q0U9Q0_PHANO|nr:hypothetical protein SNOG_11514 [Parastagonospora nodorum SN15]EAT81222.1 hypothetical protein SNOG_11514 [Parastagonospora nodorum SN15]
MADGYEMTSPDDHDSSGRIRIWALWVGKRDNTGLATEATGDM